MSKPIHLYRSDKEMAEDCVSAYLATCDSALTQARGGATAGMDGLSDDEATRRARHAWAALRMARVFAVGPAAFGIAYQAADRFTTEASGLDYIPRNHAAETISDTDSTKYIQGILDGAGRIPFPDPLPFDACFLSYGKRLRLSGSVSLLMRMRREIMDEFGVTEVKLYGHLLAMSGETPVCFAAVHMKGRHVDGVGLIACIDEDGWTQPMTLDPWVLTMLIRGINDHKTIIESALPGLNLRMERKKQSKLAKELLPLPAPFYIVHLRDAHIEEAVKKLPKPRLVDWSHRWDVRGHEVVRVVRGKLPISDDDRDDLRQRGYRIYDIQPIPGEDAERLLKRRVAPRAHDEWIAILSFWRDPFVKGPPGATVCTRSEGVMARHKPVDRNRKAAAMLIAEIAEGRARLQRLATKEAELRSEQERLRALLAFTDCPKCSASYEEKVSVCTTCHYDAGDEP